MNDASERVVGTGFDQSVYVIRHHAPRDKSVAFWVEVAEGGFDQLGNARLLKPIGAMPSIREVLNPSAKFARSSLLIVHGTGEFGFPATDELVRNGVCEPEGEGLHRATWIPVREESP